jgi:hypothetical protein
MRCINFPLISPLNRMRTLRAWRRCKHAIHDLRGETVANA